MLKFRTFPSRLLPIVALAALSAMVPLVCRAQAPKVETIDYQAGLLNVKASGEFASPQVEVWESNSGQEATEMVILSFPGMQADVSALQRMGEQLLLQNPELKRFLVSPLESDKKGAAGFQIALEIAIASGAAPYNPTISAGDHNQWLIALKQNAGIMAPVIAVSQPSPASSAKPVTSSIPVTPQRTNTNAKATPMACPAANSGSDPTHELQAQIARLQASLAASERNEQALQVQLLRYDDMIREYMPDSETGNTHEKSEMVTIQNLRLSLLKLAQKLKATEKELETQTTKNQALQRQVSTLQQAPRENVSVAPSPTLLMHIAESTPPTVSAKPPVKINVPPAAKTTVYMAAPKVSPLPSLEAITAISGKPAIASTSTGKSESTANGKAAIAVKPAVTTAKAYPAKPAPSAAVPKPTAESLALEKRLLAALHTNPKHMPTYMALSDLYLSRHNWAAAERTLSRMLQQNPAYEAGYYQLAWVYVYQKRKLEAQAALDTYRILQPKDKIRIQALRSALNPGSAPSP